MEYIEKNVIARVKQGDNEAFEELMHHYKNMIYKLCYSIKLDNGDFKIQIEDLHQEGCMALYQAVLHYDESKGAKFSSFAYLVIKRRIIRKAKEFMAGKTELYSIDAFESPDYLEETQALRIAQNPVDYHHSASKIDEVKSFCSNLTERDKNIIGLLLKNQTYQEIAHELDISEKAVDNRLYRIRKELKKYLINNTANN